MEKWEHGGSSNKPLEEAFSLLLTEEHHSGSRS